MDIRDAVFQSSKAVVDTHCHYNLEPIFENWKAHWEMAQARGVVGSWIPGTTVETSKRSWEIAQEDEHLWSLVGVHPGEVGESPIVVEEVVRELRDLIVLDRQLSSPRIIGIGEIGLDYFRLEPDTADQVKADQKGLVAALLSLAKEFSLIVSLHVRDRETPESSTPGNAYWDMLELIRSAELTTPFILHCSSGPLTYVRSMLELGAYVSFAGNVTYNNAQALREIWKITPSDRRLIETDVPFLPPQGWRGKMCEPWMVVETAQWIELHLS